MIIIAPMYYQDNMAREGQVCVRVVNLLSGYPDASICRYPTDSDIIKLVFASYIFYIYIHKLS